MSTAGEVIRVAYEVNYKRLSCSFQRKPETVAGRCNEPAMLVPCTCLEVLPIPNNYSVSTIKTTSTYSSGGNYD
ncbi:hypothetical protein QVD17_36365 [Tagetes erecta]|uniref:Uncharacterized protein n=1 Tax=Tagetes erecta TaxID=13708 RepID=A0AAD8JUI1_TARER|nr:hypothetical protein QVD17_36365 [Tagetes erecta]